MPEEALSAAAAVTSVPSVSTPSRSVHRTHHKPYCMSEVIPHDEPINDSVHVYRPFPIVSFNHLSREVLDYRVSRDFYVAVLGFIEIPRPSFEVEGVWLYGFGLSLHLIKSRYPEKRMLLKGRRLEHFENAIPNVDHFAFITSNIDEVERQLQFHNVFYKRFDSPMTGISQIFLLDPDHNVLEISNCAPPVGEISCLPRPRRSQGSAYGVSSTSVAPVEAAPRSRL